MKSKYKFNIAKIRLSISILVFLVLIIQPFFIQSLALTSNTINDTLYVFDDFNLAGQAIVGSNSGFGWAESWRQNGNSTTSFLVSNRSLSYPSGVRLSSSGGYVYNSTDKGIGHGRYLSNGIVLGSNDPEFSTTFYVSFLAQKNNTGFFRIDGGDGTNVRFSVGANVDGTLKTNIAGTIEDSKKILFLNNKTYLVVARWNFENNQSDLKVILFEDGEPIPESESGLIWDIDHKGGVSAIAMNYFRMAISKGTVMLDEFRVGSTWTSVMGNLNTPKNLTLNPEQGNAEIGDTTTMLSWDDVDNETGYKIYIDDKVVGNVATDVTEFQITGLNQLPKYNFSVAAFNKLGTSVKSNIKTYTVNNPIAKDFYVKDYGAVGDGINDDFDAIVAAVKALVDYPYSANLHFEKGNTYRCWNHGSRGMLFTMDGVSDKSIHGNGANLIVNHNILGLRVTNCDNILLQDLTFDYDSLYFTQGKILSVDDNNGTFVLEIEEGYPMPVNNFSNPNHGNPWGMLWEGTSGYEIKNELVYISQCVLLDGRNVKFTVGQQSLPALNMFNVNDRFSVPLHDNTVSFNLVDTSNDMVFKNLTYYSAEAQCFINSRNRGRLHFDGIHYKRKPGTTRLMTVYRGGIINRDNAIGPIIENCYIEGLGDDAIALSSYTYFVNSKASSTQFTLNNSATFDAGDTILFVDMKNGIELGKSVIGSKSGNEITTKDAIYGVSPGENEAQLTTNVMNLSKSNNHFIIRNNTFAGQRRHAILCRAQYGLIEGNVGEKTGYGIVMTNEIGPAYSCPIPGNIVIKNNSFTNIRRYPVYAHFKAHTNTPDQLFQNLTFIDNTFGPSTKFSSSGNLNFPGEAVVTLKSVGNVEFTGNILVNDADAGAISLTNSRNIIVKCGNTFNQKSMTSINDGISIIQYSSTNDVVFDNCETNSNNSINSNSKVRFFPVPAIKELQIDCDEMVLWSVINLQGLEVLSGSQRKINVSKLQPGVYLIKIINERTELFVKSFIKQ